MNITRFILLVILISFITSLFAQQKATITIDASKKEGGAIKKREEVHRMAEANRAFSHFS